MKYKNSLKDFIVFAIVVIGAFVISWTMTCLIIKLITFCFGLDFSFKTATGIWCVILLLRTIFTSNK